jgi:hypothetical protein
VVPGGLPLPGLHSCAAAVVEDDTYERHRGCQRGSAGSVVASSILWQASTSQLQTESRERTGESLVGWGDGEREGDVGEARRDRKKGKKREEAERVSQSEMEEEW